MDAMIRFKAKSDPELPVTYDSIKNEWIKFSVSPKDHIQLHIKNVYWLYLDSFFPH